METQQLYEDLVTIRKSLDLKTADLKKTLKMLESSEDQNEMTKGQIEGIEYALYVLTEDHRYIIKPVEKETR